MADDIRWKQRYASYTSALQSLSDAIKLSQERPLSALEAQGLIQSFEFTHELAWKLLKDYLEYQGTYTITGSRDAVREAFKNGLIAHGDVWMKMIPDRNLSTHTYEQTTARAIMGRVIQEYYPLFLALAETFHALSLQVG